MMISMKKTALGVALFLASALVRVAAASAEPAIGKPAPDFTLNDVNGKRVSLSDFKGKHVVLEWTNPDCPFVKKHYGSGNMQSLQKEYTGQGVAWLSINSSGVLIYAGGIDNISSADPADIPKATNYVRSALSESIGGKRASTPSSKPYGCSVKY